MTAKTKKKAPITGHPAFPVTVALWFAALFGMGSLLVQPGLLESLVLAIRLDRLIPAAAPPLGFTARTLVAVLLAGTGGLIGFAVGRAIRGSAGAPRREAPAQSVQRGRAAAPAPAAEAPAGVQAMAGPADDNDDLARLEAAREGIPPRRRGLHTQLVADTFADPAPMQAPEPTILNLGDLTAIEPIGSASDGLAAPGTFAAPAASEPAPARVNPATPTDPLPAVAAAPPAAAVAEAPAAAPQPAAPEPVPARPAAPAFRPRQGTAADVLRQAPLDTLGVVELVERFALALAERRVREAAPAQAQGPAARPEPAEPHPEAAVIAVSAGLNGHANGHLNGFAPAPVPARPFDMPAATSAALPHGTVEWLSGAERAVAASAAQPLAPPAADPADLDDEPEDGHRRSLAEGGWALPDLDDEPIEAEQPEAAFDEAGPDYADDHLPGLAAAPEPGEQAFSSLLAIKPAARQAGAAPNGEGIARPAGASPETTEEALRKALATLQRMSGAA